MKYSISSFFFSTSSTLLANNYANKIFSKYGLIDNGQLKLANKINEKVPSFKYLGFWINEDMDINQEIKARIAITKSIFGNWNRILTLKSFDILLCLTVLNCYVWSRLLHGYETQTLKIVTTIKLGVFKMRCYRRI